MSSFTTFLSTELLDHAFRNAAYSAPTTVYLALFTSNPGEAGSLTNELDQHANYTTGYTRQSIAFGTPASDAIRNTAIISFGPVTVTSTIAVTHAALMDVATLTSGNMMAQGAITVSKNIDNGDSLAAAVNNVIQSLV